MNPLLKKYIKRTSSYRIFELGDETGRICSGFILKPGIVEDAVECNTTFYSAVYVLRGNGTYIDHHGSHFGIGPGYLFQRNPDFKHSLYIDPQSSVLLTVRTV